MGFCFLLAKFNYAEDIGHETKVDMNSKRFAALHDEYYLVHLICNNQICF